MIISQEGQLDEAFALLVKGEVQVKVWREEYGKFLSKKGQGVQQVCLRVEDLNLVIGYLKDNGIEMINDEPMQGSDNSLIAFVHPRSTGGVLIELTQTL